MVLYVCLIPNKGARIGHQSNDYFTVLTYCIKNNFKFVYHPFTCNSHRFENVLQFSRLHKYNYTNTITDKVISINDLLDMSQEMSIFEKLIQLDMSNYKVMLFDSIQGNEKYSTVLNFNITKEDIIETKKKHRGYFLPYYNKMVSTEYICIHIRCGDIVNDESRYLSVNYFMDKYKYLVTKFPKLQALPVYIIVESNFSDDNILFDQIDGCNIIKTDDITSFYYLVNCKILIASRSGFSNLAYILGNMHVIKPPNDWNCYWDNFIL